MSSKSFYDIKNPEEAISIYKEGHDNLYDKIKIAMIKRVMKRFGSLKGKEILEIGAAGGIWTKYFIAHGANVTCVDLVKPILDANKAENPSATMVVGDATNIKLQKKFDIIFAKDVIEHIDADAAFLLNMHDHLKDDGIIVLNTQNSWCLNYLIQGSYHRLRGNKKWFGWDPTHVRFYNYGSFKKKLSKAGFAPRRWFGSYYLPYRLLSGRLGKIFDSKLFCLIEASRLSDFLPLGIFGWNIGVIAKKSKKATHSK